MGRFGALLAVAALILASSAAAAAAAAAVSCKEADRTRCRGTERADKIAGSKGRDVIRGLGGADTIEAGGGDDRVDGGEGSDEIHGGRGRDTLYGGVEPGAERGRGDDRLYGGDGSDVLRVQDGVFGNDAASCGDGTYDAAFVDTEDEAGADCEAVEAANPSEEIATGTLADNPVDGSNCPIGTHVVTDEASGEEHELEAKNVDLALYEGQRVAVYGVVPEPGEGDPAFECDGAPPVAYVTRVEPAGAGS